MKAEIITETVYEGFTDWSHDGGYEIKRIVVPEANNLAVTIDTRNTGKNIYIWENFERDHTCIVVKEILIPDEFVREIVEFMREKNELASQLEQYLK